MNTDSRREKFQTDQLLPTCKKKKTRHLCGPASKQEDTERHETEWEPQGNPAAAPVPSTLPRLPGRRAGKRGSYGCQFRRGPPVPRASTRVGTGRAQALGGAACAHACREGTCAGLLQDRLLLPSWAVSSQDVCSTFAKNPPDEVQHSVLRSRDNIRVISQHECVHFKRKLTRSL